MSRAHQHYHHYPVASTSYHQPPAADDLHRIRTSADRRQAAAASAHPDLSHDIYIPESQEELNRVSIESRLLQPSGPSHVFDMRKVDLTSASSTFDTYDRIGRDDDMPSTRPAVGRPSRVPNAPAASDRLYQLDTDESLIPGVGRGVRSTMPSQTSYQERIRSLNQHATHNRYESSPARSPYRPGKYSSVGTQARRPIAAASTARPPMHQTRAGANAIPRQAQVESESESEGDSASDSGDSDAINVRTATFNSTGNHRNFAATPAGHTATMTANLRQRPTLGQDTLDRIEFDIYTDTDGEHRPRRDAKQQSRPRPDPAGPFASPRAANTFGMNAADYQQHLASRTLTSPALRTLIGDRSKSPDSPTPAPSIDGILHAGRTNARESRHQDRHEQPRAARQPNVSAISAFEDLARRLQKDVESTRRNADGNGEDVDDGSASNSGGSGFGPGSQASSARTRVEPEAASNAAKAFNAAQFNSYGYPAHQKTASGDDATAPWGVRLPDVTGLTSALGSPVKARDTVKHRPFDSAVGNQEARLEELVNLRCFVDGIQVELDRAGERILNLEQAQEQQSQDFQGLRSEMQTALKDVRAQQPASDEQLMHLILQKLQVSEKQQQKQQTQNTFGTASDANVQAQTEPRVRVAERPARETRSAQQQESRSQVEVVNRLYAELDQLRTAMEEQYRSAADIGTADADVRRQADSRPRRAAYKHQDNYPSGRDPWEAIEALRLQVLSLADEVEGLNGLVLEHLVEPATTHRKRNARSSAARQHRFEHDQDAHAASDPIYTRSASSARTYAAGNHRGDRVEIRTDPIDPDTDDHYQRRHGQRSSPARHSDEEYDQTIDAIAENLRLSRSSQQRRHTPPAAVETIDELSDNEISQLAEARASHASARISTRQTHDSHHCTVCGSTARSEKRKASRRAKLLQAERRRDAVELEESILLETLDPPSGQRSSINAEQSATLKLILQEHWDEFLHQRMLYSELADELKSLSPSMSQTKRRILAQHVLEAVELLEVKADRIERLENVLKGCNVVVGVGDGVNEEVRKHAGSRQGGNRLKQAMESFERSTGRSASRQASGMGGRNSPPTTIQL
ncbi:Cep57_MT_bd domain-containing protein [Pseudozyma hubeiensis]|nr:Cep57_MT_bd domain-containing protein [Pseudozyma hubeiensis]